MQPVSGASQAAGSFTFGADNQLEQWDVWESLETSDYVKHWSEPSALQSLYIDFGEFEGTPVYGERGYGAPDLVFFMTNPGRWSKKIEKYCYLAEDRTPAPCPVAPIPVPPALLLLATGIAVLAASPTRRTRPPS
jgi:hypothetical protein